MTSVRALNMLGRLLAALGAVGAVGSAAHGTSNRGARIGRGAGVVLVHLTRGGEVR